jgi:hypothetical protein
MYYCNINRSLSAITVITFIDAIETKKWSLNLIFATVLARHIEWLMKPPLWLEKKFLDTDKLAKDDFYSFAESDENSINVQYSHPMIYPLIKNQPLPGLTNCGWDLPTIKIFFY